MATIHVVGSGPSGAHFALTRLERGDDVVMVDVGNPAPDAVAPARGFDELKTELDDPTAYFLGADFEGVMLPSQAPDLYGIPPSKRYVFEPPTGMALRTEGFAPLLSFARGGLAQAWTAGSYTYDDADLAPFPFEHADIASCYDEVAGRIGINGAADDLAQFIPPHENLLAPLRLDSHSALLLERYAGLRERLNRKHGFYLGRSRIATLTADREDRGQCTYLGRCLWGCPVSALYTPSTTLDACRRFSRFRYVDGTVVRSFRYEDGRVRALCVAPAAGGPEHEIPVDHLVLAAGAIGSTEIVLRSVYRATGELLALPGLMDNRQLYVPFITLRMLGRPPSTDAYQYHLLAIGLPAETRADYVHGQITTLKSALMHPIIQRLPFDLATATSVARAAHAALGVINVNFRDTRRPDNVIQLTHAPGSDQPLLTIRYAPDADEPARIAAALKRIRGGLRSLGCFIPPGMIELRPMGSSVHYAGTLPMSAENAPWTTDALGRCRNFENLLVVDGAALPAMPAKNPTFTLMANAVRIARAAF
ncbi:MAG: GMC family oxidoreductase [Gammaproteobacteria bacterium]|nr:GMC family oxidoreductase [Gammaproteobacteria bacterium]